MAKLLSRFSHHKTFAFSHPVQTFLSLLTTSWIQVQLQYLNTISREKTSYTSENFHSFSLVSLVIFFIELFHFFAFPFQSISKFLQPVHPLPNHLDNFDIY